MSVQIAKEKPGRVSRTSRLAGSPQTDLFRPSLAKFEVLCRPSGRKRYILAASFNGAVRGAKEQQKMSSTRDREFYPRFWCWERGYGEPKRTGTPPEEFEWPKF
jgi:hypothetical protein